MAIEVTIRGGAEFPRCAAQLREEAKALRRNVVAGARRAVTPLQRDIRAAAGRLPSGYAPVMAGAVRVTTSVRLAGASPGVRLRVRAKGKREDRDVAAVDAGTLRHPVFGNRSNWSAQRVRPDFVTGPWEAMKPRVADELGDVLDAVRERIERG